MAKPMIKVEKIGKKYKIGTTEPYLALRDSISQIFRPKKRTAKGDFWALKNVSFEVKQGEVLGIIGANGAGKSTLLKLLSKITPPTEGKITLRGRVASLLEVGTGFHPELTGRENIFLNGSILGMSRKEIRSKFDEIVNFAEIGPFLDTPVKRYSSGMYVRLAFAVAAHLEPEILVVDEVLSVGDAQFQKKCLGKMQDVSKSGRTVLFVSHNLGAVKQLCQSCILLDKGSIVSSGGTEKVIAKYLSTHSVQVPIYKQAHNRNKRMNLRKVELNPHKKKPSNRINYDEEIKLGFEYEINEPISDGTIWFAIQTADGVIGFCSSDYDLNPELRGRRSPGYYRSEVTIPGKWLNTGQYLVILGVVQNSPVIVYDRRETIAFTVIDNGSTPNAAFQDGTRKGILQPFLKWESQKIK